MFDASFGKTIVGALIIVGIVIAIIALGLGVLIGWALA